MIDEAVKLLFSGRVSRQLWLAAFLANVVALSAIIFLDEELFPEVGFGFQSLAALFVVAGFVIIFVTMWKLTRSLAAADPDERGDVVSWIAWGVLSIAPVIALMVLLELQATGDLHWFVSSLSITVATGLTAPLSVHATGRAINGNGPPIGTTLNYWLPRYGRLVMSYLIASVPLVLIADTISHFGETTPSDAVLTSFVTSALYFASSLLCLTITVIAYREAEADRSVSAS